MPAFIVILFGLLAGLAGHGLWRVAGSDALAARMPWMAQGASHPPDLLWIGLCALLGAGAAWVGFAVRSPLRLILLGAAGIGLCFSGSAAIAPLGVIADPFPIAGALALSGIGGAMLGRSTLSSAKKLSQLFTGRLSPEKIRALTSAKPPPELNCENRAVAVLTCRVLNGAEVGRMVGPAAFMRLAEEFRQRACNALMARGALILAGPAEMIQACFGVPVPYATCAKDACQGALILQEVLHSFISQRNPRGGGALRFGIGVTCGIAPCGLIEGDYQVSGAVLESGRELAAANSRWQTGVLLDAPTLEMAGAAGLYTRLIDVMPLPHLPEEQQIMELRSFSGELEDLPAFRDRLAAFSEGVELSRAGDASAAVEAFLRAMPQDGSEDLAAEHFLSEAKQRAGASAHSPPASPSRKKERKVPKQAPAPVATAPDEKPEAPETLPETPESTSPAEIAPLPASEEEQQNLPLEFAPAPTPAPSAKRRRRRKS